MQLRPTSFLQMVILLGMFSVSMWSVMERAALVYSGTLVYTEDVSFFGNNTKNISSSVGATQKNLWDQVIQAASGSINVFVDGASTVVSALGGIFNQFSLLSDISSKIGEILMIPSSIITGITAIILIAIVFQILSIKMGGGKI